MVHTLTEGLAPSARRLACRRMSSADGDTDEYLLRLLSTGRSAPELEAGVAALRSCAVVVLLCKQYRNNQVKSDSAAQQESIWVMLISSLQFCWLCSLVLRAGIYVVNKASCCTVGL